MPENVTRIPECHCLNCGKLLDTVGGVDHEDAPEPGCVVLCLRCGAVQMLGDNLSLRGLTEGEMDYLTNDAEYMSFLARLVGQIRLIPKMN